MEYHEELYKAKKYHKEECVGKGDFVFLEIESVGEWSYCQCVNCGCIFCIPKSEFATYHVVSMDHSPLTVDEKLDTMYQIRQLLHKIGTHESVPQKRVRQFFKQYKEK